jgi:hypothetical protein
MFLKRLNTLIFFLLFYLMVFGPDLKFIDIQFFTSLLIAIFGMIYYLMINSIHKIQVYSVFLLIFVFFTHLLIWSNTAFGLIILTKFTIFLFASKFYIDLIINRNKKNFHLVDETLIKFLFFSGVLDSIFPILFFFNPGFHESILNLLDLYMKDQLTGGFKNIRFNNLSMAGGTLSLIYLFCLLSGCVLFYNKKINIFLFSIGFLMLFFAIILTGRIGLFLFVVLFVLFSIYQLFKLIITFKVESKTVGANFLILIFLSILLFYFYKERPEIITFAFEFFIRNFESGSTNELFKNHFVYQLESVQSFLFGNGTSSLSDVGYINLIYTYGIFVFIYFCVLYLMTFNTIFKKNQNLDNKMTLFLSKILIISYLIIFIKQIVLGNEKGLVIMIMMILWSACLSQRVLLKKRLINKKI